MSNGQEGPHGGTGRAEKCRILVADDDPVLQMLLSAVLEKSGYPTKVVDDGAAAVAAAADHDLALIDLHMPVMDGLEAARRIRADETGSRRIVIVAMSAGLGAAERERCLAAGVDDFLTKPFDLQALLASVERLTSARSI